MNFRSVKLWTVQSGQTKRITPAMYPHYPRAVWVHCTRTTPRPGGSASTLYPHYPRGRPIRDQEINDNQSRSAMGGSAGTLSPHYPRGQCGDIVPVLPPGLGVVRGQCTRTSGGSAGTMFGGGAGTLQGYCVLFAPTDYIIQSINKQLRTSTDLGIIQVKRQGHFDKTNMIS